MRAQYLTIERKQSQMTALANLANFSLSDGDPVDAEIVRASSNISLYCLDDVQQRAIFVELPLHVDVSKAAFVYQTQYEHAQRLIAVPYATFRHLARALPAIDDLIMIYMTGRSGSTLLSHVFNELPTVLSLAEPDVATQFVQLRTADGRRDAELRDLLDCSVRFLCKPTPFKTPSRYALKVRNEGLQVMDLFQATFPHAKNLFLYRDALGFVASFYRIAQRLHMADSMPVDELLALGSQMANQEFTHLKAYLDADQRELSVLQYFTLWWLGVMEHYLAQYARGIPVLAVRYADLNVQREAVLSAIFTYCGIPAAQVRETLGAFVRDAQAGTHLARDNAQEGNQLRLSDAQRQEITAILKRHPVINDSDFSAPGTLHVSSEHPAGG